MDNDCDQGVYEASTTATWVHEIRCSPVVPVAPGLLALMNIELAVIKLAFQKNVMLKKFVGMQAQHVANGNAVCVKPELLVRRLDF